MISETHINSTQQENSQDYTSMTLNSEGKTEESVYDDLFSHIRRGKSIRKKKTDKSCSLREKAYKKTPEQVAFLEEQFLIDPKWSRKTVQLCKKVLDLRSDQVYKWGFDKKKTLAREKKSGSNASFNRELGLKTRREIFMHSDLNSYVTEIINGFDAEGRLASLNELSLEVNSARVSNFVPSCYSPDYKNQKVRSGRTTVHDYKGYDDNFIVSQLSMHETYTSPTTFEEFNFTKWNGATRVETEGNFYFNFSRETNKGLNYLFDYQDPFSKVNNFCEEPFGYFF